MTATKQTKLTTAALVASARTETDRYLSALDLAVLAVTDYLESARTGPTDGTKLASLRAEVELAQIRLDVASVRLAKLQDVHAAERALAASATLEVDPFLTGEAEAEAHRVVAALLAEATACLTDYYGLQNAAVAAGAALAADSGLPHAIEADWAYPVHKGSTMISALTNGVLLAERANRIVSEPDLKAANIVKAMVSGETPYVEAANLDYLREAISASHSPELLTGTDRRRAIGLLLQQELERNTEALPPQLQTDLLHNARRLVVVVRDTDTPDIYTLRVGTMPVDGAELLDDGSLPADTWWEERSGAIHDAVVEQTGLLIGSVGRIADVSIVAEDLLITVAPLV